MKKQFLHMVAFFALAAGLSLTSCSKEDPAEAVDVNVNTNVSEFPTATINGIAHATTNGASGAPAVQYAPQGTKLYLTINNSDLFANGTGVYMIEGSVGTNGAYSFTIPTTNNGVTAKITGNEFTANYTTGTTTELHVYGPATVTTSKVYPNGNTYEDGLNYGLGAKYQ